jgi:hypothetical protein
MTIDPVIPVVLSAIAIFVSGLLFYFGYRRGKKSEQVRISREIWNEILKQNRFIHEWPIAEASERIKLKRYMDSLRNDLDYFVFFVKEGEISERKILQYYRKKVTDIKANINEIYKSYPSYIDVKDFQETKEILGLIEKYNELTDNIKGGKKSKWTDLIKGGKKSDKIQEDKKSDSSKN